MVIDDDESIGKHGTRAAFKEEGYPGTTCIFWYKSIITLKQKRPNLILLDLMLPGMSGERRSLSQIQRDSIIVVSAKTDADSKVNLEGSRLFN